MTEPTYATTTERVWRRLPEAYRTFDASQDWAFKKYISSVTDQLSEVDQLHERLRYVFPEERPDYYAALDEYNTYERPAGLENPALGWAPIAETSDLFDGRTADVDWLPYIGQLIGADLSGLNTEAERRDAVILNYLGFRAGSREALEDAAKRVLTGTKYVRIYPQRDGAGGSIFSTGTQWDILIITKDEETPSFEEVIAEILRKGAKPAGVVLHAIAYSFTWEVLEFTFPTWTSIEATGSWDIFEIGNPDALPE